MRGHARQPLARPAAGCGDGMLDDGIQRGVHAGRSGAARAVVRLLWRDSAALPDELVFDVDCLGGHMPTFALNLRTTPVPSHGCGDDPGRSTSTSSSGAGPSFAGEVTGSCVRTSM